MKVLALISLHLCLALSLVADDRSLQQQNFDDLKVTLRSVAPMRPQVLTLELKNTGPNPLKVIDPFNAEVLTLSSINEADVYQRLRVPELMKDQIQSVVLLPNETLRVDISILESRDQWQLQAGMMAYDKLITQARIFAAYWPAGKTGPALISNLLPFEQEASSLRFKLPQPTSPAN